jgi:uncharacterized damage-inducible protein DinB
MNVRMALVVFALAVAGVAAAQPPAPAPPSQPLPGLVMEVQNIFNGIKGNITKAAAQFPDDKLTWQPTPLVRSWARLIAHVADDNNGACSALAGATRPARLDTEDTANSAANKMSKADLEKALGESFALCDKAFGAVTEANMAERNGNTNRSKIGALVYNTSHINEHYGNIVTYMRLNGLVPPSTAARGGK